MANPEHLELLKQGVATWNYWRREHPEIRPDLVLASLSNANLRNANLSRTNLSKAQLTGVQLQEEDLSWSTISRAICVETDLTRANLSQAILFKTDLSNAILHKASLIWADMTEANLCQTDLSNADLRFASLNRTNLIQTNLSQAMLSFTILGDVNLSQAIGLEAVRHFGPSTLGVDTIIRSHGNIPEVFLRGIGSTDSFITYARSLVSQAIDFHSCFISYSSKDDPFAKRLYADLQNNSVRCWFAPEDMKIGDNIHVRIDEYIRLYDKLLLVLSEHSLTSTWVEREVAAALEKEQQQGQRVLFPIRLDESVMQTTEAWAADIRRRKHIGDFTRWKSHVDYQQALERLLRDLKAET